MTEDLRATLHDLARRTLNRDGELPDGDLSKHLDSIEQLALMVSIEEHFQIAFEPEDEAGVTSLDDVIAVISRELGEKDA